MSHQFKREPKYSKFIQEYYNEFANRSIPGFFHSAKGNQQSLFAYLQTRICISKIYLQCQSCKAAHN